MSVGVWIWSAEAAVSAATLAARRPWTAVVAAPHYDAQVRAHPAFRTTNAALTAGWTAYFALAAVTTAVSTPAVALVWAVPTPLLGWLSFRLGDRYGRRRASGAPATKGATMATSAQADLRQQISGKSDDEILAFADQQPGGIAALLDITVAGMPDALQPAAAADCVIGYEISAPDGTHAYRVVVADGAATTERRDPDDARVVLQLSGPDYLRLITGLLDGTDAFMSGRMRIRGDVMFAPQVGRMFATT